ncbi:MAG: hypothetical protein HYR62_07520 [Actinobacteria bacterium]|nr:hypothetical protein [Actinomycetota bacterium]MBI3686166.1 hypothetical protein [Actinomycetota bacterium]
MTWNVGTRHEVVGVLTCDSPLHVGGWDPSAAADLAVARDGLDRPMIPGTSLAGALRGWLTQVRDGAGDRRFTDSTIRELFGHLEEREQLGSPARIRIDDAPACDADLEPVIRDGVAIDRRTGSAAAGFLYEREVLPVGATFSFRLAADEPPGGDPTVAQTVELLVTGLRTGQITIGAGRTRGLGRVTLTQVRTRQADLSQRDGMLAWLAGSATWRPVTTTPEEPVSTGWLSIDIDWEPAGPLLVKDSLDGALVDTLPLTERTTDDRVHLLLPGSSVKGVLRAHAERIVRTLRGTDADASLRVVLDRERLPGVVPLFGSGPQRPTNGDRPNRGQDRDPGWRGALEVADCHSTAHVTTEQWQAVITAHPTRDTPHGGTDGRTTREARQQRGDERDAGRGALTAQLDALNNQISLRVADHVAIDRWTGGAAEGLLYSVLEPTRITWEPLRLRLDTTRLAAPTKTDQPGNTDQPLDTRTALSVALLLLILRDLADGWLTVGFGGTRGRGQIAVDQIRFTGAGLAEPWSQLTGRTLEQILNDPPPGVAEAMTRWAETFPNPHSPKVTP